MAIAEQVALYEACMERMAVAYKGRMLAMCKAADLTPPQFWALKTIQDMDRTKMSPLADRLGLSMGAASTLVDRLVSRGFVERAADVSDRRVVHVSLSLEGRRVLMEAQEARRALAQNVFAHISPDKRPQVLDALEALALALEAVPGPVDQGICEPE
ncbi:MAG: MarR family transcriptional regulator [Cyanobacteria bacterium RYN_339]|nr:MarR family transcriptional regulator [Cyanobacteria bacterium RYN_339]